MEGKKYRKREDKNCEKEGEGKSKDEDEGMERGEVIETGQAPLLAKR